MTKTTKPLKKMPVLLTDEEAERFVDEADLSEYDLSGFKPVQFEFADSAKAVEFTLPPSMEGAVKAKAEEQGIAPNEFMLNAIEQALHH